ncbi:MAG: hypothetical protein KAQ65_00135 [Candidatus Thorarchaeota archaeon]|nr:hypothetical protein [Candidatus Thorarchaeota archaeon]MCK5238352.1 hypothetical protein [Candidatus Thorarchaeota archaeon]
MFETTRFDEDEPQSEQRSPADLTQGFWFDDGLYKEWLTFLYTIWNTIEYL